MDSTLEITRSTQPDCTRITTWPALTVPWPVWVCVCICVCTGIFHYPTLSATVSTCMCACIHVFCKVWHTFLWISEAAGWNFDFMLTLAATLDKSGMTTTASCCKTLDVAAGYPVRCDYQLQTWCHEVFQHLQLIQCKKLLLYQP